MSTYLFLFSISSVQSFISQARKTQDFAAGSRMISYLMDHAMQTLKKHVPDAEFIFPQFEATTKPHRYVACITSETPKKLGQAIETAVQEKFQCLARKVRQKHKEVLKKNLVKIFQNALHEKFEGNNAKQDITSLQDLSQQWTDYDAQLNQFLDIHWVMLPYDPKEEKEKYVEKYRQLERLLREIKNTRPFQQLEERGRKCSLDGILNVKIYRKTKDEEDKKVDVAKRKLFVSENNHVLILKYDNKYGNNSLGLRDLQPGEGLSAVSFTKRCLYCLPGMNDLENFPSTARVALMNTLQEIEDDPDFENYKKCFEEKGSFDEQLLYEENLTQAYFEKYGYRKLVDQLSQIQQKHTKLQQKVYEQYKKKLNQKYYALLRFDGDNMGKWLSGDEEYFTKTDNLLEFHKMLSERLGEFAQWAQNYLKDPEGQTVYVGGDDFLGFINLECLFKVLRKLRNKFDHIVNKPLFENSQFLLKNSKRRITFSAGLVIAHYKTPLREVISWSKRMEEAAKHLDYEKDAIGMVVLKHSGEMQQTVWKWNVNSEFRSLDVLEDLVNKLKKPDGIPAHYSNTFITNLKREFSSLIDNDGKYEEFSLLQTELQRLLERSCQRQPDETSNEYWQCKKKENESFAKTLIDLFKMSLKKDRKVSLEHRFDNFTAFLYIADFIARKMAGGD